MLTHKQRRAGGFTIVELLIVIVVIAILAAISIVTYSGIQERARDSRRAQDIATIKKTLLLYDATHGGVQGTSTYGGDGPGTWNISSMVNWLTFLNAEYGKMPVDPLNTGVQDPYDVSMSYEWTYYYFCYSSPSPYVTLGYFLEQTKTRKQETIPVNACL